MEGFALENAGVLGEQAEEDADQKAVQVVAGVAASLQGVVKVAHDLDGLDVDRVLLLECVLLVAGNEGELMDVTVKFGEREFVRDAALLVEQRQVALSPPAQGHAGQSGQNRKR